MKKSISRILCTILVICTMLMLSACGIAGTYKLKEMSYGGVTVSADEADVDLGESYIQLEADGTAVLCMDGTVSNMAWKDGQIWAVGEEANKADFIVNDNDLTLNIEGIKMVFSKE